MSGTGSCFSAAYLRYALGILTLTNVINYMDRMVLSVVLEDIKHSLKLSDTQIGLLAGFAFAIFYAALGIGIAHLADRYNRARIIALSMLVWSTVTALTGAAHTFGQIFLARIGVGVGEAGVIPTANALIADYYKPARRPAALGLFSAGAMLGVIAGLGFGGWVAHAYGWRWAFVLAGTPGVPLCWVIWKTLRAPRQDRSTGKIEEPTLDTSLTSAIRTLTRNKMYIAVVTGGCFVNAILFGVAQWMPAFLIRKFALSTVQAGFFLGTALGSGAALGAVLGGLLSNRLAQHDRRWMVRIPLVLSLLFVPLYEWALSSESVSVTLVVVFVVNVSGGAIFGPMLAAIQSSVPYTMRATAAALYGFAGSLIGIGGAPLLVGVISDVFAPTLGGVQSLQLALSLVVLVAGVLIPISFRRALWFSFEDGPEPRHPEAAGSAAHLNRVRRLDFRHRPSE